MALTKVTEPFAVFTDTDGSPLDGGFIYVGTVDQNPETSPITVYYDEALSIPAAQPLRTANGYVMRSGSPAVLYVDADYSITVRDKNGALVIATQSNVGVSPGGALIAANNLSDVDDAAASLVNLGLTATAAELNQIDGKSVIGTDTNILTTPAIAGQALKYLRVNAGETAAEFNDVLADIPTQLQATWNTGTDTTESLISPLKLDDKIEDKLNVTGAAPMYVCRAWVNFDGTGTVAIRASGNVSSITDNGTGNYSVNFTTAMEDINYSTVGNCTNIAGATSDRLVGVFREVAVAQTTSSTRIKTRDSSNNLVDPAEVHVAIFR